MNQQAPGPGSEEVTRLGEPRLVCRVHRKTVIWGFLLAVVVCVSGIAVLLFLFTMLLADWSKDITSEVALLAAGVLLLWGGRVLWRKANRLRRVLVVVHAGGLSSRDDSTCLTCRWDEIEDVRWRVSNQYESFSIAMGISAKRLSHTSHYITVKRKDGVEMVFTDELENIFELAGAIQQHASRNSG